jgi:thymidine phosphorylase
MSRPDAYLARAPIVRAVPAPSLGAVGASDTRAIGVAVVALGGGRQRAADTIDPSVGFSRLAGLGDPVGPNDPLGVVHAATEAAAEVATHALQAAYRIGPAAARGPEITARIDTDGRMSR